MAIKRSGWVAFASILFFVSGGLLLVLAIEGFSGAAWLDEVSTGLLGGQVTTWAIIDLILAIVALVAGYSIWYGGKFGWWIGVIAAVLGTMRAFFYIPIEPIAALIVIAIDVMIIYGLTSNHEYFGY